MSVLLTPILVLMIGAAIVALECRDLLSAVVCVGAVGFLAAMAFDKVVTPVDANAETQLAVRAAQEAFTDSLRRQLLEAAVIADIDCYDGGVYAATQGPRLESAAEVDCLERDGADYVGMTAMPEAAIARELGLDYACIAMVVNRAAGRGDKPIHEDVEASTLAARSATMALLRAFFRARSLESA